MIHTCGQLLDMRPLGKVAEHEQSIYYYIDKNLSVYVHVGLYERSTWVKKYKSDC